MDTYEIVDCLREILFGGRISTKSQEEALEEVISILLGLQQVDEHDC